MPSSLGGPGRLLNFDEGMKTPFLGLVLGFWGVSNVLVIAWWWADISDRFRPGVLSLLVGISIAVPKILIWMHPGPDFRSFLIAHGDYFSINWLVNLLTMKLAVAVASLFLAIVIVRTFALTRTMAIVLPASLPRQSDELEAVRRQWRRCSPLLRHPSDRASCRARLRRRGDVDARGAVGRRDIVMGCRVHCQRPAVIRATHRQSRAACML